MIENVYIHFTINVAGGTMRLYIDEKSVVQYSE
jgi:hypothetical protein